MAVAVVGGVRRRGDSTPGSMGAGVKRQPSQLAEYEAEVAWRRCLVRKR